MIRVTDHNCKNALLEIAQDHFGVERPQYIHFDYGPHHAKVFRCLCTFHEQMTSSIGRTKIEAEQLASQAMLHKVQDLYFEQTNTTLITTGKPIVLPSRMLEILDSLKHDPCFDVLSLYGDAVIRCVIAQYLYDNYSEFREGVFTLIIAEAMRGETRRQVAISLKLEPYVKSEITTRTLVDTLNAVIGKLNLLEQNNLAKKLILDHYQPFIDHAAWIILSNSIVATEQTSNAKIKTIIHNFKNELQEYAQKYKLPTPSYHLINREGADHAPIFTVKCIFDGMEKIGTASTVKSAQQNAAKDTLESIYLKNVGKERTVRRSRTYANHSRYDSSTYKWRLSKLKHQLDLPDFVTLAHLMSAFTHPSLDSEENYQRLEFLGDAILRMLIIDYLVHKYPTITDKAFLSPLVDRLVSAETQIKIAKKLQLHKYVLSSASITEGMLGDVLEALIAAIYIDAKARSVGASLYNDAVPIIINWFKPEIVNSLGEDHPTENKTIGSDNFPASTLTGTVAKAAILTAARIHARSETKTTNQATKKAQAAVLSVPKIHEDFPALRASTTRTKTDNSSKFNGRTTAAQAQTSADMTFTATDTQVRSYAKVATTKQTTKKPPALVWSAPKVHEDFPTLSPPTIRTKTTNNNRWRTPAKHCF